MKAGHSKKIGATAQSFSALSAVEKLANIEYSLLMKYFISHAHRVFGLMLGTTALEIVDLPLARKSHIVF